ncbi:XrtA system polysaccharide chain length determinant [Trichloromonas sp.]|uniref:XrtA system polysaccharide chain length determinant n=1 Tax=Trichloromonas sp. TaxID=3069249 RepID=UPI002A390E4C|nr:GNVR domain-containing protein [Trichloromonas sp.]
MDSPILQLKKYLHALYNRRYLFLLISVTTALLIVISSFFYPKMYEAKSTVFIEENVVNSLMKGITVTPSMADRIRVLRYHMLSRDIISRVLKKLDMDVKTETSEAFEGLIRHCQETTEINLKGSDLFFVSFIDSDPQFAQIYINTLVNTYVEENLAAKREESFGANRFLSEQVAFYKKKLDDIEDEINNYRKKTGIMSTASEASLLEEIKTRDEDLKGLRLKKLELTASVNTMREQLNMMKSSASSQGSSLLDLIGGSGDDMRIDALRSQLEELLLVYNDQYPAVVKLREQIAELEKRQAEQPVQGTGPAVDNFNPFEDPVFVDLKMRMNTAQAELNALLAREREFLAQIEQNKKILANFPQDKKILADMERERSMTQNVYETLLERVGVAEVSKQMEVADKATTFRIVDPAILPTFPVGVKRLYKMLLGIALGIGAGLAGVFAREKLDDTVKDADMIRSLGVTVLAEIPYMYNEEDTLRVRKWDRLVYSYAGVCLFCIAVLIGHDLLGLSVFDRFIAYAKLDTLVSSAAELVR